MSLLTETTVKPNWKEPPLYMYASDFVEVDPALDGPSED